MRTLVVVALFLVGGATGAGIAVHPAPGLLTVVRAEAKARAEGLFLAGRADRNLPERLQRERVRWRVSVRSCERITRAKVDCVVRYRLLHRPLRVSVCRLHTMRIRLVTGRLRVSYPPPRTC